MMKAKARATLLVLFLAGCAPPACSDDDERALRTDVGLVVQEEGSLATAAHARLVARGADAIPLVETGFYAANPAARIRLLKILAAIDSPEAQPVLVHMAKRDPDATVREVAQGAISAHSKGKSAPTAP
jgi:hypothetical protein